MPTEQLEREDIITGEDLAPVQIPEFQQPEEFPVFNLAPTEQKTQDLITDISEQTTQLQGQEAERQRLETQFEIPELTKTQEDLSRQLRALQREAQAIPLQLQQESIGRGITEGGLRPLQTARLRENAIQALTTSSLLEAAQGNLSFAQQQVDRALEAKYGPIREEINTKIANLELLLKSPALSAEQEARAQAQLRAQEREKRELDQQLKDEAQIRELALVAAQSGADSVTLRQISTSDSLTEALNLASPFLVETEQPDLQFISGTANQPAGVFNKQTGEFTPLGGFGAAGAETTAAGDFQAQREERSVNKAKELLDRVSNATVGIGSLLARIPGTPARNFQADLDTLKANIAFAELQAMRNASKTGGALGQVSERELGLLESALAGLNQGQSPENMRKNLNQIISSLQRFNDAVEKEAAKSESNLINLKDSQGNTVGIYRRKGDGTIERLQ